MNKHYFQPRVISRCRECGEFEMVVVDGKFVRNPRHFAPDSELQYRNCCKHGFWECTECNFHGEVTA